MVLVSWQPESAPALDPRLLCCVLLFKHSSLALPGYLLQVNLETFTASANSDILDFNTRRLHDDRARPDTYSIHLQPYAPTSDQD